MEIREVIVYDVDGKRFDKKKDAEEYYKLYKEVCDIVSVLGEEIKDDKSFKKHNVLDVKNSFKQFCLLCEKVFPIYKDSFHKLYLKGRYDVGSICCCIIRDCSYEYPILTDVFFRYSCISFDSGIEYTQPYYVKHPEDFFIKI